MQYYNLILKQTNKSRKKSTTDSANPMGCPHNVRCHFCICRTRKIESKENNFDLLRTKVKAPLGKLRTPAYQLCRHRR